MENSSHTIKIKLQKNQTGIASEFYVAGELSRLGYNVTITFGNTKSVDLLIQQDMKVFKVQVKGMQSTKSGNWNVNLSKLDINDNLYFVLVNLHVDKPLQKPEFYVLTTKDVFNLFVDETKAGKSLENRSYLSYSKIEKLNIYKNRWSVFDL